ncbi:Hypothetical predicted protein [Podarcis lilfordi]|uniref:Uncharacterized protein n=1 Tax=Podarcis lilfordi TaxID=74358 RepID=A0AA35P3X7_9SAUR|nr:Hypothetical predicted protein [Podarcis lilfordi]
MNKGCQKGKASSLENFEKNKHMYFSKQICCPVRSVYHLPYLRVTAEITTWAFSPGSCQHLTWNPGGSGFSPKLSSHAGLWYGITDDNLYTDFVGP